jgi:hypothetical protein
MPTLLILVLGIPTKTLVVVQPLALALLTASKVAIVTVTVPTLLAQQAELYTA